MGHKPFVYKQGRENTYLFLGNKVTCLASGEETGGQFAVLEMYERKGMEPPPHVHHKDDETFYVLEGEVIYDVEGEKIYAEAGTFVYAPSGKRHSYSIQTDEAVVLVMVHPAGFDQFTKELSEPFTGKIPPKPSSPPSGEQVKVLVECAAKYGIEILLPS